VTSCLQPSVQDMAPDCKVLWSLVWLLLGIALGLPCVAMVAHYCLYDCGHKTPDAPACHESHKWKCTVPTLQAPTRSHSFGMEDTTLLVAIWLQFVTAELIHLCSDIRLSGLQLKWWVCRSTSTHMLLTSVLIISSIHIAFHNLLCLSAAILLGDWLTN
jgi:hypothetical protein